MMDFCIKLEYADGLPVFRQLSNALKQAIADGRLKPGDAMPSVRDLAHSLCMSRTTILKSFAELQKEGYLHTINGTGSFVSPTIPRLVDSDMPPPPAVPRKITSTKEIQLSRFGKRMQAMEAGGVRNFAEQLAPINFGGVPLESAPIAQWRRLLTRHSSSFDAGRPSTSSHPLGLEALREAVSSYLLRARSVHAGVDRVAIFATKQLRLHVIARLLLDEGDLVAFEEPGYSEARCALAAHGAEIMPVPVDHDGIDVSFLESSTEKFKLVYVTPSHQDPTGAVLSLERRRRLLAWARRTGAFIIEDDFDSQFQYGKKPLPSLQGMDRDDCVIYLGSLWKVMYQALRLSYVVVPQCLSAPLLLAKEQMERYLPLCEQRALTDFLNEGCLEMHIRKTQSVYAKRRSALILALTKTFGTHSIARETGSTHVVVRINSTLAADEIVARAQAASVPAVSTAQYYMGSHPQNELMIDFATVNPENIEFSVDRWATLIREGQ